MGHRGIPYPDLLGSPIGPASIPSNPFGRDSHAKTRRREETEGNGGLYGSRTGHGWVVAIPAVGRNPSPSERMRSHGICFHAKARRARRTGATDPRSFEGIVGPRSAASAPPRDPSPERQHDEEARGGASHQNTPDGEWSGAGSWREVRLRFRRRDQNTSARSPLTSRTRRAIWDSDRSGRCPQEEDCVGRVAE
jgi:hypothetical protein